jgi:anti-sigma B factor antagonist
MTSRLFLREGTVEINRRSIGNVTILDLSGRLAVSPSETEIAPFHATIGELIGEGRVNVAVQLSRLARIDARGLGELVAAFKKLSRHGGCLTLVAPSARVRKLLAVTRLDSLFPVCDSEGDALRAGCAHS